MPRISFIDYKKRNIGIWNEVAPRYHKRWARSEYGPFQSTKELVKLIGVKKGDKVLDVACGTGLVTKYLSKIVGKKGFVVGVDSSVTAIKIAKQWNGKRSNLNFVNVDAEKFYFKEKFDAITCQYALFFFPNALRALKIMNDALNDSGKLGISVHGHKDKVPFFGNVMDAVTQIIPDYIPPGAPSLDRFGTKTELKKEVEKAGFSRITIKDFVFKYTPGNFEDYWADYLKYLAKPLKEKIDSLERRQKREIKELARENSKSYTKRSGKIEFPWQVLILTAKK